MPSTYTPFANAKPVGTATGPTAIADANINDVALWYGIVHGAMPGWVFSVSGGTTAEPAQYRWQNGSLWIRATNTWSGGYLTAQLWEVSTDSAASWATIASQAFTYDANGYTQSGTAAGGIASVLYGLIGRLKALATLANAHSGALGTAVHGLGSMALQAEDDVFITGGAINGTPIGGTTPSWVHAIRFTGSALNLGNISGNPFPIDWNVADYYYGTLTGATTFSFANLPATGRAQGLTLEIVNPGAFAMTWPAAVKWPGGVVPTWTASGVDIIELSCRDGATVRAAQAMKDSR